MKTLVAGVRRDKHAARALMWRLGQYIDMNNTRHSMRQCGGSALHAGKGFVSVAENTHTQ